jgi:hypothetical protein
LRSDLVDYFRLNCRHPMRVLRPSMVAGLEDLISFVYVGFTGQPSLLEIGSNCGESTAIFADSGVFSSIHCVDPWGAHYYRAEPHRKSVFNGMVGYFSDGLITSTATESDVFFAGNTSEYDVVYIDGCHRYDNVVRDCRGALSVKPRIIAGHDWRVTKGVAEAVMSVLGPPDVLFSDSSWLKIAARVDKPNYYYRKYVGNLL